jgi:hypothetical protein
MDPDLLSSAAGALPLLPPGITILLGGWGIWRLRQEPMRARSDRKTAVAAAALGALVVGALTITFIATFSTFGGPVSTEAYLRALPFGLAAAALASLAAIGGYALLARPSRGGIALAGALLGPALFIGAQIGAVQLSYLVANAAYDAQTGVDAGQTRDRSTILHLQILQVNATLTPDRQFVASVRLRATIHADAEVVLEQGKIRWPRFTFLPDGGAILDAEATAGSAMTLGAGSDKAYELTFEVPPELLGAYGGTTRPPTPGTWTLQVTMTDANGADHLLQTKVEVVAEH